MNIYILIAFLGLTILLGIGAYALTTRKLHEHRANGNEEYTRDVAKIRIQVTGLFMLFVFIQLLALLTYLLR